MPQDNCIKQILEIKEEKLTIDSNIEKIVDKKGNTIIVFKGKYSPDTGTCPSCGRSDKLISHGFKDVKIKLNKFNEKYAILHLKKRRFLCKHCGRTHLSQIDLVEKGHSISKQVKMAAYEKLTQVRSNKNIAESLNISDSTVGRILRDVSINNKKKWLPEVLSFDEFKSTKSVDASMSFIYIDPRNSRIIDILPDRRIHVLEKHFMSYPQRSRNAVRAVVIDMYSPYMSLIKKVFPNAKIILDKFHISQLVQRSLNKSRVETMNEYKNRKSMEYKRFKRYRKPLLKKEATLNCINFGYRTHFKKFQSEKVLLKRCSVRMKD